MKNLEPPPSADVDSNSTSVADRFQLEIPNSEVGNTNYGLILRKTAESAAERRDIEKPPVEGNGLILRKTVDGNVGNFDTRDLGREKLEISLSAEQKLKEDIEKLPDDRGFEEFEDISVEDFSKALLAGYGWKTGQGIGRNAKEDTKVREYKRWAGNGGLGFKSELPVKKDSDGGNSLVREEKEMHKKTKKASERKKEESNGESHSWLASHIKVRIISEEFKRGRFYLKKGKIVDVIGPMICDVLMDESGEILQGVSQEILETALPRRGGSVLVLSGRHKGCYGTLVEKDSKRTAIVRDEDNHELIKVRLEQIAEYVGDPRVLGY